MNTTVFTASHYGVVRFGDLQCEAVVLKGGERGYVRRQLDKLLGFHETHKGGRFARFLADFHTSGRGLRCGLPRRQAAAILRFLVLWCIFWANQPGVYRRCQWAEAQDRKNSR